MANLLFTPFPARGHVNPMQKLIRVLTSRGHRVVCASMLDARAILTLEGLDFMPLLDEQLPEGSFQRFAAPGLRERMGQRRALARRYDSALRAIAEGALETIFERVRPELLICDPLWPYPALVAHGSGVPTLLFNTSLPRELVFPFLTRPPTRLSRRLRTRLMRAGISAAATLGLVPRLISYNERIARRYGYPVDALGTAPEYLISSPPELILAPRDFVLGQEAGAPRHLYTAPSIDLERPEPDFPWERLAADKPLIYFSMGSMGGYGFPMEEHLIDTVLAAARARPGWQFVFAVNPTHDVARLGEVAPNVVAVKYAPQLQLLQRAAAAITHGGFNTVKECIYFGVPMVVVPLTYDQPAVARLVEQRGLGVACPPRKLNPRELLQRLDGLLAEPTWRAAMDTMRSRFRQSEQENPAADAIERLLQARRA